MWDLLHTKLGNFSESLAIRRHKHFNSKNAVWIREADKSKKEAEMKEMV